MHAGPVEGVDRGKAGAAAARAAVIAVEHQGALGQPLAESGGGRSLNGRCLLLGNGDGLGRNGQRREADEGGRETEDQREAPVGAVRRKGQG